MGAYDGFDRSQQLAGHDRAFLLCGECERFVTEMYAFRQASIRNNRLMTEYVGQLRSFGGEIGELTVKIIDVGGTTAKGAKSEGDFYDEQIEYVDCGGSAFGAVKAEGAEEIVRVKIEPGNDSGDGDARVQGLLGRWCGKEIDRDV